MSRLKAVYSAAILANSSLGNISSRTLEQRKRLFSLTAQDALLLLSARPIIVTNIEQLVRQLQTRYPDLKTLPCTQQQYILGLFSGTYNLDYVKKHLTAALLRTPNTALPQLHMAAIPALKQTIHAILHANQSSIHHNNQTLAALEKLLMFNVSLLLDTYYYRLEAQRQQHANAIAVKAQERIKELEEISRTDPLTNLLNPRHLHEILTAALHRAKRRHEYLTLVYMDVNNFKDINDTQGHLRGNEVLKTIAQVMHSISREEDYCFRCGGDEFCVILPNCNETQAHIHYVARLHKKLAHALPEVGLSAGIATTGPNIYQEAKALIKKADERMYISKAAREKTDMLAVHASINAPKGHISSRESQDS